MRATKPTPNTRLYESDETDTEYTTLFEKGWPGTPHRVLQNDTLERWQSAERPPAGDRPGEDDVVARTDDGDGEPVERYDEALATPDVAGDIEDMALFAGQSVGLTDDVRPAGALLEELVAETQDAISGLPDPTGQDD